MTANAERILKIVSASTEHLTAEEMYAKLALSGEKMSLSVNFDSTIEEGTHLLVLGAYKDVQKCFKL